MTTCEKHKHSFYTVELSRFIYTPLQLSQAQLPPMTVQFKAVECCAMQKEIKRKNKNAVLKRNHNSCQCHWNKGNLQITPFLALLNHSNPNDLELGQIYGKHHILYLFCHLCSPNTKQKGFHPGNICIGFSARDGTKVKVTSTPAVIKI